MEQQVVDVTDIGKIQEVLTNPLVVRLVVLALIIIAILSINWLIRRALNRTITDTDRKYRARKAMSMIAYVVIVFAALVVYSDKLGNIGIALGVAGAGIAFALQEVIVSIAGWLTIMIGGAMSVGQRVKIGDVYGDVIDIGVFRTTVMETGAWVDGDLYNGRIVTMSNGFVFKEKVHNYSAEYPFLWDEVKIPIRHGSDHVFTRALCLKVLNEVCGEYTMQSKQKWKSLTNKFRVEPAQVEPMVAMQFDHDWMTFTLRYIVDYKKRRITKDRIFTQLIEGINQNLDKVSIASSAMEVTSINPTP